MRFHGDAFYSYGTVIGRRIRYKGTEAFIVNVCRFSSTTSEHQGLLKAAIPNYDRNGTPLPLISGNSIDKACLVRAGERVFFYAGGQGTQLSPSPRDLYTFAIDQASQFLDYAERPRVDKDQWRNAADAWLSEADKIIAFYDLKVSADMAAIAKHRRNLAQDAKKRAKAEADQQRRDQEAQAQRAKDEQRDLAKWTKGGRVNRSFFNSPVKLRIDPDDEMQVQTSRGATVTVKEARRAFRFACKHRAAGWRHNGETFEFGGYAMDAVNTDGVVVGCHRIAWDEIERFAKTMKW
jgi:hypothetical protein